MAIRSDSKFAFASPSLSSGAARLLDWFNLFDRYSVISSGGEWDARAHVSDWAAVGDAIRLAAQRAQFQTMDRPPALHTTQGDRMSSSEPGEQVSTGLPSPAFLARYEQTLPGSGDRLLVLAERQLRHRQRLEEVILGANIAAQRRGMWLGFLIGMSAAAGGFFLILTGHLTAGILLNLAVFSALVAIFVYGERRQQRELDRKHHTAKV